ncbi:MAG: DUF2284 domain-containing protein [Blautia sp.]|nr:DUF2284 domain-containing protein [Blautia sp.]
MEFKVEFMNNFKQQALECGFDQAGYLKVSDLRFEEDVRKICESNQCGHYNKTWACPPAVGTLEECRERCRKYESMLLFNKKYELEDSFDFEGMLDGMEKFKDTVKKFHKAFPESLNNYLILANEGCRKCEKCTWPDQPCRFGSELYHPIESYGFRVDLMAADAGLRYYNGPNTVTYFGAVMFRL